MISYAQNYEDVYLARCFPANYKGFFIDIGASHPIRHSVTYHFYVNGWRGINVEPIPTRMAELQRARPHDTNLQIVVSDTPGDVNFHVVSGLDAMSSMDEEHAKELSKYKQVKGVEKISVPAKTLVQVCEENNVSKIDFLKIDVEGAEEAVIRSGDWKKYRPTVVVIEATKPGTPEPAWEEWEPLILEAGYLFAFFDGLNRYYVATERQDLLARLNCAVNPFDNASQFHAYNIPLTNPAHPDHAFAIAYCRRVMLAPQLEPDDHLLRLYTSDLIPSVLSKPVDAEMVREAYKRVLAREPDATTLDRTLKTNTDYMTLFRALLKSDEFRFRRTRISL